MKLVVLAILTVFKALQSGFAEDIHFKITNDGISGTGITTRYWDCCETSCSWAEGAGVYPAVSACAADGVTKVDDSAQSGCNDGGTAFVCSNQQAIIINSTLAYGFSAASFTGGIDEHMCCYCMLLSFQGELSGKQMVVQITNTGSDLNQNQFDIAIPGGGVGIFTKGCTNQWGAPVNGWGDQYGGVSSDSECSELPTDLQPGCHFRFQWMEGVPNPNVSFVQVDCPSELTSITGCHR